MNCPKSIPEEISQRNSEESSAQIPMMTHTAILCIVRLRLKRLAPLCPKLLPMNRPSPKFIPKEVSQHDSKGSSARIPKMKCPMLYTTPSCIPCSTARPPRPAVPPLSRARFSPRKLRSSPRFTPSVVRYPFRPLPTRARARTPRSKVMLTSKVPR